MGVALNSLLGTLVAGCPGQAWGNLVSLVSHCQGCCGLVQTQRVQKPWQEQLVTAVDLGSGVRSQEAGSSDKLESLDQPAQAAHRSAVPG